MTTPHEYIGTNRLVTMVWTFLNYRLSVSEITSRLIIIRTRTGEDNTGGATLNNVMQQNCRAKQKLTETERTTMQQNYQ